jgi:hypothetical protein
MGCWATVGPDRHDGRRHQRALLDVLCGGGTASSFRGVRETIIAHGLFSSFYSDRCSHYWITPDADGKVDKENLTQFGRAMKQLGIDMIAAYSPEARGRSERAFGTHQGRLPQELALAGITHMEAANRYLREDYLPAFNAEFAVPAMETGSAFVPWIGGSLDEILCEKYALNSIRSCRASDMNSQIKLRSSRIWPRISGVPTTCWLCCWMPWTKVTKTM